MKSWWCCLASLLTILTVCRTVTAEVNDMEGCVKPTTLAEAVTRVQAMELSNISLERIQTIWPTELKASGCTPESCLSLEHQGRIINGQNECTEKIEIIPQQRTTTGSDRSLSITIYFSTAQKSEIVDAAKLLAQASGLAEAKVSSVGQELDQQFQWDDTTKHEYSSLWVNLSQRHKVWIVDWHLVRYLARPHGGHSPSN